eukprot:6979382-Prymnesium_polylepis.1
MDIVPPWVGPRPPAGVAGSGSARGHEPAHGPSLSSQGQGPGREVPMSDVPSRPGLSPGQT